MITEQSDSPPDRPWERLDPTLGAVLAPLLPALADDIVAEIARAIPEYRRPIEGAFGGGLRTGVREALGQFVDLIGHRDQAGPAGSDVYSALGRGELRAGRGLDALQAAYRLGARVAWRRVSQAAHAAGADAAQLAQLADSIFAYIDEISSQSVEGYARAQAAAAGEQQRRRERLVRTLVASETPPLPEALRAAAAEAEWPLPRALAALVGAGEAGARLVRRLGAGAITGRVGDFTCALVPDPDAPGMLGRLDRPGDPAGPDSTVALGPTVAPAGARLSYVRAREALRLRLRGVLDGGGLVVAEEHLGMLVLFRDTRLLDELADRRLAPLAALTPAARRRLEQTLLCWLRHQGSVPAVADELHVHRQTVRYRLGRLRELLGDTLDDAEGRLELELALRGRAAAQATAPPAPVPPAPGRAGDEAAQVGNP